MSGDLPLLPGGAVDLGALRDRQSGPINVSPADGLLASQAEAGSWTAMQWLSEAERANTHAQRAQRSARRLSSSASSRRMAERAELQLQARSALLATGMFCEVASKLLDGSWKAPVSPVSLSELRGRVEGEADRDVGEFAISVHNALARLRGEPLALADRPPASTATVD